MDIFKQLTKNLSFAKEIKPANTLFDSTKKPLCLVAAAKFDQPAAATATKGKKRKLEENETKFSLTGSVAIEATASKKKKKNEIQKMEQIKIEQVNLLMIPLI